MSLGISGPISPGKPLSSVYSISVEGSLEEGAGIKLSTALSRPDRQFLISLNWVYVSASEGIDGGCSRISLEFRSLGLVIRFKMVNSFRRTVFSEYSGECGHFDKMLLGMA